MEWIDRTAGSPAQDVSAERYPLGYWCLRADPIKEYYLDKLPYGQWRLNPEDGTDILYFDDLMSAKHTMEALVRMGAIKTEE